MQPASPTTRAETANRTASDHLEVLMSRYLDGDESAFEQIYASAYPVLKNAVGRWTRDAEQIEDVLQATFLKLHRKKESYRRGEPLLPWLYVIAKRTLMDERRPLRNHFEVLASDGVLPTAWSDGRNRAQARVQLREALTHLPEQYRDAITITRLAGFSGNEAALALNTTKAAIKQRVHRGYNLLREFFDAGLDTTAATA